MIKNLLNKRKYITVSSVELNDNELNEDEKPNIPSGMSVSYTHLDVYKRQGFIYALKLGRSLIRSGEAKNALIIGAETLSKEHNFLYLPSLVLLIKFLHLLLRHS